MRKVNRRFVIVGVVLILAAIAFFFYMQGIAPRSNDPRAMMATVGQVSGVAGVIGVAFVVLGLLGKKFG